MTNSTRPPYRVTPSGVRFVKINGDWINTVAIESIRKPQEGPVVIRMASGDTLIVHGVYSQDALARGILAERYDEPDNS